MRTLKEVLAQQAAIRARLKEIEETPEPAEDAPEAERAAYGKLGDEADALIADYDALETERVPLQERADRLAAIRSAQAAAGDSSRGGKVESGSGPDLHVRTNRNPFSDQEAIRSGMVEPHDLVARARWAIEQAPDHMSDDARHQVTSLLDRYAADESRQASLIARHLLLTGSPEYHAEFREYARTGRVGELMRRAMNLADDQGGYLVPFTLDPTVILTNTGIQGPIRRISRVETIATDVWHGVSSAGVTAEWTAETTEAADKSPTFSQPTVTPKKADAYVQGSYEVLADSGFASSLGRLLADAKVRLEEAAFATANTGATQPRGVVAAVAAVTTSIVASATTNALVAGDVYNVESALPARFADSAQWIANRSICNKLRQLDTSGGAQWWANLGMGQPEQLLGAPIHKCSTMQSAVTTGGLVLLAGDFSNYLIVDRVGMSVLYEPMVKGSNQRPTGEAGWYAFWRVGADVLNAAAFRVLQLNQTAAAVALA